MGHIEALEEDDLLLGSTAGVGRGAVVTMAEPWWPTVAIRINWSGQLLGDAG